MIFYNMDMMGNECVCTIVVIIGLLILAFYAFSHPAGLTQQPLYQNGACDKIIGNNTTTFLCGTYSKATAYCNTLDYMHRLALQCDGKRSEIVYNMVYTTTYVVVNGNYVTCDK